MHRTWFGLAAAAAITFLLPATGAAQMLDDDRISEHEWVVSGQVGSAFGASAEDATAGVTGTLTYLRDGAFGAELLAGFTPDLDFDVAPTDDSSVGNYMANGVAALPLGVDGRWQPFVSAGLGAMTISSEFANGENTELLNVDDTQLGGNVGVGLMTFSDRWGVRGDVRYFTGLSDDDSEIDAIDSNDFLSNVDYWHANIGVAYRW